jgi:type VI secretion system protein ImpB
MAEASVAPKERVNIVYKSNTGDKSEEVELPLKMLMIGDYTGKQSEEVVEDRKAININKDNFDDVMKSFRLDMDMNVTDTLSGKANEEVPVHLDIKSMKDFSPDSVAQQVPELNNMLELRKALLALKGPLGNVPTFRKTIQGILNDDKTRAQIMTELGIE